MLSCPICVYCGDAFLFGYSRNAFTFISCLRIAEMQGDVPSLPKEWWYPLITRHHIKMEMNENIQAECQ